MNLMDKPTIILILILILALTLLVFVIDSINQSQPVTFYKAPGLFCNTEFVGITLPPFGAFLCSDVYKNKTVRAHERVHWNQYKDYGTFGFYGNYLWGMIENGFDYRSHFMEVDARNRTSEFIKN